MNVFFYVLSSKKLTVFVVLSWLLAILFSWWFIHPRVDEGIYLVPAINTLQSNVPGVNFSNSIEPIFFIFPAQPFLHGIFLKILSLLHVDIAIETYRLFNLLSTIILFYLVYRLFSTIFVSRTKQRIAGNLSLILLGGFSQFSLQFFVNRPEILGLLFFMLGLIYFVKFFKNIDQGRFYIAIACFYFGISSILHPNFMFLSSFALIYCIYIVFNNFNLGYLKYFMVFFIPVGFFVGWLVLNFDIAQDQLFNRVQEVASITAPSIINIFSTLSGDDDLTFLHNIYLQVHMLTLLLVLFFLLFHSVRKFNIQKGDDIFTYKLFKTLSISIFSLLFLMQPYRPNYLLVSFISVVVLSYFLTVHSSSINLDRQIRARGSVRLVIFLLFSLLPLSLPFLQTMKNYVSDGMYDNHHKTLETLKPFLGDNRHIFITTAQLLPLFANNINIDLSNVSKLKDHYIHWYFPVADSPGRIFKELMRGDIKKEEHLMQNAIWGSLNKTTMFDRDNITACLSLKGGDFFINLYKPEILFKDRQNIFLTSSTVVPSNECFK